MVGAIPAAEESKKLPSVSKTTDLGLRVIVSDTDSSNYMASQTAPTPGV